MRWHGCRAQGEFDPQPPVEAQQFRRAPFAAGNGRQNGNRGTGFAADSSLEGSGFEPVWGFSCQAVVLGSADSFLFGAGKAVFRPVAWDQVRGARGRGQGTETVAKLGGLPPSGACVSQRLDVGARGAMMNCETGYFAQLRRRDGASVDDPRGARHWAHLATDLYAVGSF